MSDTTATQLTDTSDMINLHRVFRDGLAAAPRYVGSVQPGDTQRAALVADYYANVLRLLHSHHNGEDELVTPKLVERAGADAAAVSRIAAQHQPVVGLLDDAESKIATWRVDPTQASSAQLIMSLAALDAGLTPHLDEEERVVLPIAARHMTPEEWGELPGHGLAHFDGDKIWLVLGLIREGMTPERLAEMDAHMPPPVSEMWASVGRPAFEEFVGTLRG